MEFAEMPKGDAFSNRKRSLALLAEGAKGHTTEALQTYNLKHADHRNLHRQVRVTEAAREQPWALGREIELEMTTVSLRRIVKSHSRKSLPTILNRSPPVKVAYPLDARSALQDFGGHTPIPANRSVWRRRLCLL